MGLTALFSGIATAIREKDGTGEPIPAAAFPERIRAIPARESSPEPLSPDAVYRAVRPDDWLELPEPEDNELYLLFHIPEGTSALLAFTVTCGGGAYQVEVLGGADGSAAPEVLDSGTKFETELSAGDFSARAAGGMRQAVIRVTSPGQDILRWATAAHSRKTAPSGFADWNIVEIKCRLPRGAGVKCGSTAKAGALNKLRFFTWRGASRLESANYMFSNCVSLTAVPELDTSSMTGMNYLFYNCYSLLAVPNLDCAQAVQLDSTFYNCYALKAVPALNLSRAAVINNMFFGCGSLRALEMPDTSQATDMGYLFQMCSSLSSVTGLNTAKAANMRNLFSSCPSLARLTLCPEVTGWAGYAISLSGCSLGHEALVELFRSLPAPTQTRELTITGNPGTGQLTEEEKAIAAGKNWTLVL